MPPGVGFRGHFLFSAGAGLAALPSSAMKAPATISTARLILRRPTLGDAEGIFAYASDPEVTRYMGWPRHKSLDDTRQFVEFCDGEWEKNGMGAYLITRDGDVIGSTGLHRASAHRAVTGYVLLRSEWGKGFATEACRAMMELGRTLGFTRIDARCHAEHAASARVLEKVGMTLEGVLRRFDPFPNLGDGGPQGVRWYGWVS